MPDRIPFRNRAHEVTRVEAFSDIVFGFALTLIVVSLEVPKTFAELMESLGGFFGFAICFTLLMWIWHAHHTYFRRYGFTDELTIALNTALLFLVLFYVYPMKFIFELATGHLHNPGSGDPSRLYLIYALGFAGIFTLFLLLYAHAWRRREQLQLNAVERHDTRTSMIMYASYVGVGAASALIALFAPLRLLGFAGWIYFLLGPISGIIGATRGRMRREIESLVTE
ncbi:MAG TPA: TMEM175 family protein [Thermoanaerobaculia bacterium]|nr:TMEM175 family protein [Thermoanaerobaculia bacterium]